MTAIRPAVGDPLTGCELRGTGYSSLRLYHLMPGTKTKDHANNGWQAMA